MNMSHTAPAGPSQRPPLPDEFERFYEQLCHTPLGQLTPLQRKILGHSAARIRLASMCQRVFSVTGSELRVDADAVPCVNTYTIIATTPRQAATVAAKRAAEQGRSFVAIQVYEHTSKAVLMVPLSMWSA